ncbi:ABC transporter ATP-binding protein [Zavarzinia sp.]|uniref:ABC transporter ATP-binding protein n=1 Tax=Zavarzinia sp. TaxID=2027920 RepID=UPI00356314C3
MTVLDLQARRVNERPRPAELPAGEAGLAIRVGDVTKGYGARTVLKSLSLEVEARRIVAIVGRSGGGKSTLLRLLAGLESPDSGTLAIGGEPAARQQSHVRLMFQDARLLPWQRVLGNVGIARTPGWERAAREAIEHVGLSGHAADWPRTLSGGQKQRVALARALVSRPGVLLLDEPFGALDALTKRDMHQLLTRIWGERGFTTVLITHDVAEAIALADRVLVLREGRFVVDVDVPLERPRRIEDARVGALAAQILREV